MSAQLEKQIVKALTVEPPPALDRLLTLVGEVESAIIEADNAAELARERFYDPVQSPDYHQARDRMESTQDAAARLRSLLPRLTDKYRAAAAAEERAKWQVRYDKLERERDELAKELAQFYPEFESRLVDLFNRLAINSAACSELHGSRPANAKGFLKGAELTARKLDDFTRDQPSVVRELRLPSWTDSSRTAWPPREIPASVLLAESIASQGDPRRHSGEWYQVLAEDVERRKAEEAQRIADEQRRVAEDRRAYEASLPR